LVFELKTMYATSDRGRGHDRVKCPNSGHFFEIALNTVIFSMQRDCLVWKKLNQHLGSLYIKTFYY